MQTWLSWVLMSTTTVDVLHSTYNATQAANFGRRKERKIIQNEEQKGYHLKVHKVAIFGLKAYFLFIFSGRHHDYGTFKVN
ncbi:hypothetical protein CFP56_027214 [Quercus suber]|uniref:Secreted protein n=1 Tax=Quercus suber TaxID=58331 RepID=A0AAW0JXD9_QUESU